VLQFQTAQPPDRPAAPAPPTRPGNALFARGKFAAAAERFTEALALQPGFLAALINRALCHKKLGLWQKAAADAAAALELSHDNVKALFVAGAAARALGDLPAAATHLRRALDSAREHSDGVRDDIWRELARTRYAQWQADAHARRAALDALRKQLDALAEAEDKRQRCGCQGALSDAEFDFKRVTISQREDSTERKHLALGSDEPSIRLLRSQFEGLLARMEALDTPGEVPSALTCPLTLSVFRDPVVTPSGCSYERAVLLQHLRTQPFDPVTRAPCSENDILPNLSLRAAALQYLEEHPWAWAECV